LFDQVQPILDDVRTNGDTAVKAFTKQFDGVDIDNLIYNVRSESEISLPEMVKESFRVAYTNITAFHKAQLPQTIIIETMPGVVCSRIPRPIARVGLYVPGGS